LAKEWPSATLRIIVGSGHMSNMEAPQVFNELVLEHLQRN
jgi:pimeloyl-ACP methyl ester carboxylesterase